MEVSNSPSVDEENQDDGGLVARFGSSRSHLEIVNALAIIRGLPSNFAESLRVSALVFCSAPDCGKAQPLCWRQRIPVFFKGIDTAWRKGSQRTSTMTSSLRHAGTATNRTRLTAFF
jgi:hypothetical protein